ncbi:FoF1 ATP synthase subunit B' [Sulfurovum sp.]|uniref:FoF1 ATP synthase subunit B' n=1 Tax=Sulfurovum sp. TaxID=1969726 RepID=UPI002A3629C8|nr:FoF1 ATP synthase subunit B' [Sulfurovum sp.]MDD2450770.1 FoF1 ATP synthase subunit B' [Sulfurovum sp.]MDD3498964.1 FoF1 ATP synthase subunit B' [Sulfurovum sp.]MDY0402516.1 FoF1 ATP synthase subunit B' [Sulfurovum sp.]
MLDLHLPLMLFVLVLFIALLVLLNNMLFQPLIKFMDDRDNSIAKDLEAAKGLSGNTDELNAKAEDILSNAKAEAAAIRQKAIDDEKTLAASKVETKQSELEQEYASFVERLASNKAELKNSLLSQMPLFKESLKAKFSKL